MTWVFAILIVLVLGGIAAVAAGRGGELPVSYDDRPDVRIAAGELSGADLRKVRFSLAFRGYRMSEVDALLARLEAQLDQPDQRLRFGPPAEPAAAPAAEPAPAPVSGPAPGPDPAVSASSEAD